MLNFWSHRPRPGRNGRAIVAIMSVLIIGASPPAVPTVHAGEVSVVPPQTVVVAPPPPPPPPTAPAQPPAAGTQPPPAAPSASVPGFAAPGAPGSPISPSVAPAAIASFDISSLSVAQAQQALDLIGVILSDPEMLSTDLISALEMQRQAIDARLGNH